MIGIITVTEKVRVIVKTIVRIIDSDGDGDRDSVIVVVIVIVIVIVIGNEILA